MSRFNFLKHTEEHSKEVRLLSIPPATFDQAVADAIMVAANIQGDVELWHENLIYHISFRKIANLVRSGCTHH